MNVLFIIPRMGGGGAERVMSYISNHLAVTDNRATILTIVGGESFYELDNRVQYESANVKVNRSNKLSLLFSEVFGFVKSFFFFRKRIKEINPDLVVSFLIETDILTYFIKKTGVKFKHVCSERNDPFIRNGLIKRVLRRVYGETELFVCQSEKVSEFYSYVPNRIVIPNPINPDNIPDRSENIMDRVVAVGRLDEQKNFELLIKSYANIADKIPQYRLDIYGEGYMREKLQALIDLLKMNDKITLMGAEKDVVQHIKDAALYIMSSNFEGFPNALLEAMSIGIPVISTDFATGIARELINNERGMVVPVGDEQGLSCAILSMLSDGEKLKRCGVNNRNYCKRFYSDLVLNDWMKAFRECIMM